MNSGCSCDEGSLQVTARQGMMGSRGGRPRCAVIVMRCARVTLFVPWVTLGCELASVASN